MNSKTTRNTDKKKCIGITKKGTPCRNFVLKGQDYCFYHYPTKQKKFKRNLFKKPLAFFIAVTGILGGVVAFIDLEERFRKAYITPPRGISIGFMGTDSLDDRIVIGPEISMESRVSQSIHIGWASSSESQECFSLPWNLVNFSETRSKDVNINFEFRLSDKPAILSESVSELSSEELICDLQAETTDPRDRIDLKRTIKNYKELSAVSYTLSEIRPSEPAVFHIPIKLLPTVKLKKTQNHDISLHPHYVDISIQILSDEATQKQYDLRLFLHHVDKFSELITQERILARAISIESLKNRTLWDNLIIKLASMTDKFRLLGVEEQEALVIFSEPFSTGYDRKGIKTKMYRSTKRAYDHASIVLPSGENWWSPVDGTAEQALLFEDTEYERILELVEKEVEDIESHEANTVILQTPS